MNEQDQNDYRQQIGLKKILYKYEHENQQLRSQIRALNQRLTSILNKPKTPPIKQTLDPIQEYQGKIMKEQMLRLFRTVNKQTEQMKINRNGIDERHEQKCKQMQNRILKQQKQIKQLKFKLDKYDNIDEGLRMGMGMGMGMGNNMIGGQALGIVKDGQKLQQYQTIGQQQQQLNFIQPNILKNLTLRSSTVRIQNYFQKLNTILQETEKVRKSIKQLEKQRDENDRKLLKKHIVQVDVKRENREIEFGRSQEMGDEGLGNVNSRRKKGGVWGLENTKENYEFVKKQIETLKNEKQSTLMTIKNQNIVLQKKIKELQNELQGVNKSVQIPPLPYQKRPIKIPLDLSNSINLKSDSPLMTLKKSIKLDVGINDFQRNNDKNFIPKKLRPVVWQSNKNKSGIQWYDGNLKSIIIGVNIWLDNFLMGLQFIHELGNSPQHLQLMNGKKIIPIQYRLHSQDYLQNVILYLNDGLIVGVEFISKNGRNDSFGNKAKGKRFDFGIRKPEKPVISFGQFKINSNNISQITKLGFEVI